MVFEKCLPYEIARFVESEAVECRVRPLNYLHIQEVKSESGPAIVRMWVVLEEANRMYVLRQCLVGQQSLTRLTI